MANTGFAICHSIFHEVKMPTPGRNEPCYCGSGRKYKHCHEVADKAAQAEAHAWDNARHTLTRDVIAFARESRFAQSFADGLKLFWNEHYTVETADSMSEDETLRFFDWFVFDYAPADRARLLDVYAVEKGAELKEVEAKQLAYWQAAKPGSAFRAESVEGNKITLRDLFDDSTVVATSEAGAKATALGEILLARLVQVHNDLRFSGTTVRLPGSCASELKDVLQKAFQEYRAEKPEVNWADFMRTRGYLMGHFAMKQAEVEGRPPVAGKAEAKSAAGRAIHRIRTAARHG
jgi:hypothetical protein